MIAYKGFNKNLAARMGNGIFQYEFGKTYKNKEAKCANTGFHCVEEPIRVLDWYSAKDDRYCIVEVGEDIHEDGRNKIAATEITLLKEIDIMELALEECRWLYKHPNRQHSTRVQKEKGDSTDKFVIVRGKNPVAAGKKGTVLYLLQEKKCSKEIASMAIYEVDGVDIKPGRYYDIDGKEVPHNDAKK